MVIDVDCVSLVLVGSWQEDPVVLVRITDGLRLCREGGYRQLSRWEAGSCVDTLDATTMATARDFALRSSLTRFSLTQLSDHAVRTLLRDGIQRGELVALCDDEHEPGGDPASARQRGLVRELEAQTHGRLAHAGRQYKLVADVDLTKLPGRERYEVVSRDEAARVLAGIAAQNGGASAALLGQARDQLTSDWRAPLQPDGLVLLRRLTTIQSTRPDAGPALTPSQIKKLATKPEWIEIAIVDERGEPYTGAYHIELPDGGVRDGDFQQGLWGDYDVTPGKCKLVLPATREPAQSAPLGTFVAFRLVDSANNPITGRSYRLKLTDGTERSGTTEDGEIRIDAIDPGTCVFALVSDEPAASG
jgi:hypothetical protein